MVIVGGCGHVGLPLALSLADCGFRVGIDDIDATKVAFVKAGNVPFLENGADTLLKKLLPTGRLELASDPSLVENTDTVILVIGTPIDEFMNPSVRIFDKVTSSSVPSASPKDTPWRSCGRCLSSLGRPRIAHSRRPASCSSGSA